MKTIAVRLDDELHGQMSAVCEMLGMTFVDGVREACQGFIDGKRKQLRSKADAALEQIDREADEKRKAITALFTNGTGETSAQVK